MCDYRTVLELRPRKGDRVQIGYDPGQVMPWRVGYRGAGHYFETPREAAAFCAGGGFLGDLQIGAVAAEAMAKAAEMVKGGDI